MPVMAMAMSPSPIPPIFKQPPEADFARPLPTPVSWTNTDSTARKPQRRKRAFHAAKGISLPVQEHQIQLKEAADIIGDQQDAGDAGSRLIRKSEGSRTSPKVEREGSRTSPKVESEGDAAAVYLSNGGNSGCSEIEQDNNLLCITDGEFPQMLFKNESITRKSAVDCLAHGASSLAEGMLLHCYLIESGADFKTFEENILMHMYGNFGAVEDACFMFCHVRQRNSITWNTMMSVYMHQKLFSEVLGLFTEMYQENFSPDSITITIVLRSCAGLAAFFNGRLIHYLIIVNALEAETTICTSLALMYARCGAWKEALFVFENMGERDEFTWTAMILASFDHGHEKDTLLLYKQMLQEGMIPNKAVLIAALKSCAALSDLAQGKLVHDYITKSSLAGDEELASFIIAMYGKCKAVDLALSVFKSMGSRTVASYNAMMATYLLHNLHRNAFQLVHEMLEESLTPDAAIYSKIVQACEGYAALEDVRDFHSQVIKTGLDVEARMVTAVVSMYGRCGEITEASLLFSQLKKREAFGWNSLLAACVRLQLSHECIQVFQDMLLDGIDPTKEAFLYVLSSCVHVRGLQEGKLIHACVIEAELDLDAAMSCSLINMYGKCGALEDARCVFNSLHESNVIHWTAMIAVYAHHGRTRDALKLFDKMQQERVEPNSVTFTNVLNACANLGSLAEGQAIHALIKNSELTADAGVANALLHMYCKCGSLNDARIAFEDIAHKELVSWNVLISAYIEQDQCEQAIQLFQRMLKERVEADNITFVGVLRACAGLEYLELGMEIHGHVVKRGFNFDIVFATSLIFMYGACSALEESCWVFNDIEEHNVVSWTCIIAVHAQQGQAEMALEYFHQMKAEGWEPDGVTLASVLGAFAELKRTAPHDIVQACNFKSDILLGNALINMYAKCSSIESASLVFENMHQCNVATWNTMICAYGQNCYGKEALKLLRRARREGISPNDVTWCQCLSICADLGFLSQGKFIHREIIACGYEANVGLGNGLINMYGKCGAMGEAVFVFSTMRRDIVSWNAMLAVLSQQGHVKGVIWVFRRMQIEGVQPDEVTFVSVLNTCSRAGLVKDGCDFFKWMRDSLKLPLTFNHYGCLADLFGKAGHLDVAEDLICSVPFCTTALLWMTLLSSCQSHGDLERGERALDYVVQLDPCNAAPYVLMSNIYALHERWADVKTLRGVMLKKGVQKQPGVSMIEIDDQVHSFYPRDRRHPERHAIYEKLDRLNQQLEEHGYVPNTRLALRDVNEESKKYLLSVHSERLALAFGLIRTSHKEPLFIVKNLRMCADCHAVFKILSCILDRKITLRDAGRFHCFSKGLCSCGDFW